MGLAKLLLDAATESDNVILTATEYTETQHAINKIMIGWGDLYNSLITARHVRKQSDDQEGVDSIDKMLDYVTGQQDQAKSIYKQFNVSKG